MARGAGIVISAVFTLLGSLLWLAMAALVLMLPKLAPPAQFPPEARYAAVAGSIFLLLGAGWGISTSVGLFRRARWSRISMLIFSALLVFMTAMAAIMIVIMPLPPTPGTENAIPTLKLVMAAFYGLLGLVGVIWLIYFTRPGVKLLFTGGAVRADPRPLSIVVIAWWLLIGAACIVVCGLLRWPAVLLGGTFTGWGATAVYLGFAAVQLYLGWGLLKLNPRARIGAMVYLLFGVANNLVFVILPERFLRAMQAMPAWAHMTNQRPLPPVWFFAVLGALGALVPLWFLIMRKQAFVQPALLPASGSS